MADDKDIREKLAKLEALFARGATAGERAAAGAARDRLQQKLSFVSDEGDAPESTAILAARRGQSGSSSRYAARTAFTPTATPGSGARR